MPAQVIDERILFPDGEIGGAVDAPEFYQEVIEAINNHAALIDAGPPPGGETDIYDIHNVRDYGAVGDGTTDDTAAIQAAITAAIAAVTGTGRTQTIYFPGGDYACNVRVGVEQFELSNRTKLRFLGTPGHRSRIFQNGNGGGFNWHLFVINDGSTDIEFRDLVLSQAGITGTAEQQHLVQIGTGPCSDIRFFDCEFRDTGLGDGLRLLGDFGEQLDNIQVHRCYFHECTRSGVSFQRWVRSVSVLDCVFYGGTDQQIDSEPTGTALTADAGSDADTINDAIAHFDDYDLVVGDEIYNVTEQKFAKATTITDATHLETSAGITNWTGDGYMFTRQQHANIIANCRFIRGGNTSNILVTLTNQTDIKFVNNHCEGPIQAGNGRNILIMGNTVDDRHAADPNYVPLIHLIQHTKAARIIANKLHTRNSGTGDFLNAIQVNHHSGEVPQDMMICFNDIYLWNKGTGINLTGCVRSQVVGNRINLNTPGVTNQSVGIFVASASGFPVASTVIANNSISADQGAFQLGIDVTATTDAVTSCTITGNSVAGSTTDYSFREAAGGTFTSPPMFVGNIGVDTGITPPTSLGYIQIGGLGGTAPHTSSKRPGIYWGTGAPTFAAGIGSTYYRYDGSAGTQTYVKTANIDGTGWVATGGVVATGSIACTTQTNYADTDFMTIGDGINPVVVYEFDKAGDGVTAGRVQVNISGDTTATQVADRLKTAIEANQPLFTVVNTTGTLALTHRMPGTFANVTIIENVAHASHTVTGMTGGVNPP